MPLKIICLEEHVVDADLATSVGPAAKQHAPYYADLGSRVEEDLSEVPRDRPRLQGPRMAVRLAGAPAEARLRDMDAGAIDMQVLSSTLAIQMLAAAAAVDAARRANERLAATVRGGDRRFAAFALLPWQDAEAACRELERSIGEDGFVGSMLAGHPGAAALIDDEAFAPVLAAHARLRVPLYLHPGPPLADVQRHYHAGFDPELTARLSTYGWGWHNEAGIQVIRLILSGAFDRNPDLQVISGHWGEMVPFFLERMDEAMPPAVTGFDRTIGDIYRQHVHVTPSGMLSVPQFRFVREVLGVERIMFAVDYPYMTLDGARAWLEALPASEAEQTAIAHGNAERLLKLA